MTRQAGRQVVVLLPVYNLPTLVLLLEPATQGRSKGSHDAQGATHNISKSNGNQVFGKELCYRNVGPTQHAQGDDKHVGNRVIQTL